MPRMFLHGEARIWRKMSNFADMNRIIIIIAILSVLVASSCSHKKNVVSKGKEYETEVIKEDKKKEKKKGRDSRRYAVVEESRKWLGVKYRYGGKERSGTDCSGMVMRVYEHAAGIKLPRDSRSQCDFCRKIDRRELAPADLVFFASKAGGSRVSHVGVYIGQGKFIHASSSKGVITSSLDEQYYVRHFFAAGRVPGFDDKSAKREEEEIIAVKEDTASPRPGDKEAEALRRAVLESLKDK